MQNLHTHTTYCDGVLSAEAMVKIALERGYDSIGFSEHSYVSFCDPKYSMSVEDTHKYLAEINKLKVKYQGTIEIFLGIEMDYYTDEIPGDYDFIIGTTHHLETRDGHVAVDAGVENQKKAVDNYFGGDYYAMAEAYFEVMAGIAAKTNADIVGHFDLVAKYNSGGVLFDETHPRYVGAAIAAIDEIMKGSKLFEVNTGAMYRLNRPQPYPNAFLLKEICKRGGEVILSSDSHDAESLCHNFADMTEVLKTCGFKHMKRLTKDGFTNAKL